MTPPRPTRRRLWPSTTARRRDAWRTPRLAPDARRPNPGRRGRRIPPDGPPAGGRRPRRSPASSTARRASTSAPPASPASSAASGRLGCGLEMGGVAVVPAAVQAPHVAHDELRVVVDRTKVGPREQFRGAATVWMMSSSRAPSFMSASVWAARESSRVAVSRRTARTRSAPAMGRPWPGSSSSGAGSSAAISPQRDRPVLRVALHLLRIPGVGGAPDDQVAGAQGPPLGHPHPRVVVGFAAGVVQLGGDASEVEIESVGVGDIGPAVLDRPLQPRRAELPLVDHGVVAGGLHVSVETGIDARHGRSTRIGPSASKAAVPNTWSMWPCV